MATRRGGREGGMPRIDTDDRLFEDAMTLLGDGRADSGTRRPNRAGGGAAPRPAPHTPGRPQTTPPSKMARRDDGSHRVPRRPTVSGEDEDLFLTAMADLGDPLPRTAPAIAETPPVPEPVGLAPPLPGIDVVVDLDPEDFARALGDGPPPPPSTPTPPRPVATTPSQAMDSKRFRQLLEKRRMKVQAELDLHGVRSLDAVDAVRRFIAESREAGLRVVRIIHGKGHHSDGGPVLRDLVRRLLRGELEEAWTALTTPPEHMGGDGATVLHLRTLRISS